MHLFVEILTNHYLNLPDKEPLKWLDDKGRIKDSLSYRDIWQQSGAVADKLISKGIQPGDRVMIVYPFGLEFITGFIGCLRCGAVAVSVYPPNPSNLKEDVPKFNQFVNDCGAKFALTTRKYFWIVSGTSMLVRTSKIKWASGISWITTNTVSGREQRKHTDHVCQPEDPAFIQYTSGSTGDPKGVVISHRALVKNMESMNMMYHYTPEDIGVCWVPQYHDYGLISAYINAIGVGFNCYCMSPLTFIRQPLLWAKAIEKYEATITLAPTFGYKLLARRIREAETTFDMSSLRLANVAAEPVDEAVITDMLFVGISQEAICPSYGMAENVVNVCGWGKQLVNGHIGCGELATMRQSHKEVVIVNESGEVQGQGVEGKILITGEDMASGYWNQPEASKRFHIQVKGDPRDWFETGDLGFIAKGELFVSGREKEVIIIQGKNFYPTDLEQVIEYEFKGLLRPGCVAVVQYTEATVGVLAEVYPNQQLDEKDCLKLASVVSASFGVIVGRIGFIPKGSLPKTTSGKLKRVTCASLLKNSPGDSDAIHMLFDWEHAGSTEAGEVNIYGQEAEDAAAKNLQADQKIAIIGGGPSGLMAAYTLIKMGYSNVTVFEREPCLGGRSLGYNHRNEYYVYANDYSTIKNLALEVGLPLGPLDEIMDDDDPKPFMLEAEMEEYKGLTHGEAFKKFRGKFTSKSFLKLWALSGYSLLDSPTVSSSYSCGFWNDLLFNTTRVFNFYPPNFLIQLYEKMATAITEGGGTILVNTPVLEVRHIDDGQVRVNDQNFDQLIFSVLPRDIQSMYQEMSTEQEKMLDKLRCNKYGVICFDCDLKGIDNQVIDKHLEGIENMGKPLSINKIDGSWYAFIYTKLAFNDAPEVSESYAVAELKKEVERLGGKVTQIKGIQLWDFFPHVRSSDINGGYYRYWDDVQGVNSTYWVGGFVGFDSTETVTRHAKYVVQKHFPNLLGEEAHGIPVKVEKAKTPQKSIEQILLQILGVRSLDPGATILEYGLTSMQVIQFQKMINKEYDTSIQLKSLYRPFKIKELQEFVESGMTGAFKYKTKDLQAGYPVDQELHPKISPMQANENMTAVQPIYDVVVVGAGLFGLHVAREVMNAGKSVLVLEKEQMPGGVWYKYANKTSRLNTSEPAYRIVSKERANINHTPSAYLMQDIMTTAKQLDIRYGTEVERINEREDEALPCEVHTNGALRTVLAREVVLCTNQESGGPRKLELPGESSFGGDIVYGISDQIENLNFEKKTVVIVGMGAFAVENMRTAIERGCKKVYLLARNLGAVVPRSIEYSLHTDSPIVEQDLIGTYYEPYQVPVPENWYDGQLLKVGQSPITSNEYFIANYHELCETISGVEIQQMDRSEVTLTNGTILKGIDILIKNVGFEQNPAVANLTQQKTCSPFGVVSKRIHMFSEPAPTGASFSDAGKLLGFSNYSMVELLTKIWLGKTAAWVQFNIDELQGSKGISFDMVNHLSILEEYFPGLFGDFVDRKKLVLAKSLPEYKFALYDAENWCRFEQLCAEVSGKLPLGYPGQVVDPIVTMAQTPESEYFIFYVHGFLDNTRRFQPMAEQLGTDVYGLNWKELPYDSLEDIAKNVANCIEFIQYSKKYKRCVVVGHSMGGLVTIDVPNQIQGVEVEYVLIEPYDYYRDLTYLTYTEDESVADNVNMMEENGVELDEEDIDYIRHAVRTCQDYLKKTGYQKINSRVPTKTLMCEGTSFQYDKTTDVVFIPDSTHVTIQLSAVTVKHLRHFGYYVGKTCVVTGGSSGIGLHIVKDLIRSGAERVVSVDLKPCELAEVETVCCDITKDTRGIVKQLFDDLGSIDVVFSNHGVGSYHPIYEQADQDIDRIIAVNLTSHIKFVSETLRHSPRTCMVFTSSLSAFIGRENVSVYTATKSGMSQFVNSLLVENPSYDLHVVYPPSVNTELIAGNQDFHDSTNVAVEVLSNSILERVAMGEPFIFLSDVDKESPKMTPPLQTYSHHHVLETDYHGDESNPVLVLFSGFPDNMNLWNKQLEVLTETHYCITICIPDLHAATRVKEFGTDEICAMIHGFLEGLPVGESPEVSFVLHDMSVFWMSEYMKRYGSNRINKLVLFDVAEYTESPGIQSYQKLILQIYENYRDNVSTNQDLQRLKELMDELNFNPKFCSQGMDPWMGYLYKDPIQQGDIIFPDVPFIFIYGNKKKEHFHTEGFLKQIECRKAPYCAWFEVDAGHWLMRENPGKCNKLLKDFLMNRQEQLTNEPYSEAKALMT